MEFHLHQGVESSDEVSNCSHVPFVLHCRLSLVVLRAWSSALGGVTPAVFLNLQAAQVSASGSSTVL